MAENEFLNIMQNEFAENNENVGILGVLAIELAQPLEIMNVERAEIPRNMNYYEEVIPLYIGDLFKEHFRMSRASFEILLNVMNNIENFPPRGQIPVEKKILFTIWVLSKPESFLAAGDRFGIARSTAHYVFKEIINILNNLMQTYIVWPENHGEAIRKFNERSNGFPGVIGAIDGSHIPIKQPANNPVDYYNRKQSHSIILQGICDHRMVFIDIFVGMPGRMHDARVFHHSPIKRRIVDADNQFIHPNLHLIGDSAYPLLQNLLTPIRDNGHLNERQVNYNKLSRIRSVIERAFGLLKGKFRRLKYLDVLDPELACYIISAACCLHNFILLHEDEDYLEEEFVEDEEPDFDVVHINEQI